MSSIPTAASPAKTVVITGTSSGFGFESVYLFASRGWNVVATVRQEKDLDIFSSLANVKTFLLDVSDETADASFITTAVSAFGRVDALVNNAGYYQMGPVEGSSMAQIHAQFQTNRSGVIVNISSISADQGYPFTAVYAASKAAVSSLTEGLNIELSDFGVTAKCIFPGQHATKIFSKIDLAEVPQDYQAMMGNLMAITGRGSQPIVTAETIFKAVTDGNDAQVRYYAGPDAEVIPRLKQMMGQEWYWQEFRNALRGNPSQMWKTMVPEGTAKVEFNV